MAKYYCLIAGLPDLSIEDRKLQIPLIELKSLYKENLTSIDFEYIELMCNRFDNANLINILLSKNLPFDQKGSLSQEDFELIINNFKGLEVDRVPGFPSYFSQFIPSYLEGEKSESSLLTEDKLNLLYMEKALKCSNAFIRDWFTFYLNFKNLLSALMCRKYNLHVSDYVVGNTEIEETIRESKAKDFGLIYSYPYLNEVIKISEESDVLERERKIDRFLWKWLDENENRNYFGIEYLISYFIKSDSIERWSLLHPKEGEEHFHRIVDNIKNSGTQQEMKI